MRELTMEEIEFVSGGAPTCTEAAALAGDSVGAILAAVAGGATAAAWGGVPGVIIGGVVGGVIGVLGSYATAGGLAENCTNITQAAKSS